MSPGCLSLLLFIDLWPVMSIFASSTFIYDIPWEILYILIKETIFFAQRPRSTLCRRCQYGVGSHPIYEIVTRYNVMVVM